ncbi:MAG TPA: hypothetical protein VMM12_09385 [Longimicrobiales bacterium]|nr:hypothetical protein [Longimicrobiales bacterium]
MPHIDDGTLHAALDGALRAMEPERAGAVEAHLEACAECRARAEAAAALRERSGEILGVLEPAVAPDFDEVLVRAGAHARGPDAAAAVGGAGLRRQLRWTRDLAWAATLVIALGTGYLIRDRLVPERAGPPALTQSALDRAGRSAADPEPDAGAAASHGADADPRATPPERSEAVTEDAARPPIAMERPVTASPGAASAPDAVEERESAARNQRPEQPAVSAATEPDPAAGDAAAIPEPRLEMNVAAAQRALEAYQATGKAAGLVAMPAVDDAEAGFRQVEPEDVAAAVGAPLLVLPGAEVLHALVSTGEGGRVVSLQRLQEGVEIRVTQRRAAIALESLVVTGQAAAAPAAAAPSPPRRAAVREAAPSEGARLPLLADAALADLAAATVPAGLIGWELVLEGRLPPEALEALARAARPYDAPR